MVTGSKGFLGKSVVSQLVAANHTVIHFDIIDGHEILDYSNVLSKLMGVDLCIHLAAVADLYDAEADVEKCRIVNVDGTRVVGKACVESGAKMLFISTVCAYGNNGLKIQTESSPLEPTEIYAETKAEAETVLATLKGLNYRVIRPATFYGPGMRDSLAIQRFINASMNGRRIEIHGTGKQTRCYTHVDDVASAIGIVAAQWPDDLVYNVANPQPTSVIELVDIIRKQSGLELDIQHVTDRKGQINRSAIDITRMELLGWEVHTDLDTGIDELFSQRFHVIC
jgi:UDP-glucose 4-epimerase